MTQDELIRLVQDLRIRVNQQSAQIAAFEALVSSQEIEPSVFLAARAHLKHWKFTDVIPAPKGFPREATDDMFPVTYLNRIEEAVTGKPVE
ncbi:hypothetical protein [Xanthobacter sp. KR7-225]|uniref:hypothetical protein n=1 Tax=Xanthobacter sp. KR7-225 TaxID=3156613 RepID=UPI0032B5A646